MLRPFVLRWVKLQSEVLSVPHAAEGFDINGVQADRITGKQLRHSILRDLPAETGVVCEDKAVIRRIFARIEHFNPGAEQIGQRTQRLNFIIRYGIKHLFPLCPAQKRTVPCAEKALNFRSRLLPEARSIHGAGNDTGTVCGKKQRFILHRHGSQVRNAGQRLVQCALLSVGVKNPLCIIRALARLDIIQPLPFHCSLHGDAAR